MNQHKVDLVIVGGGIHGAAVASIASQQGLSVCLLEQFSSPAQGTSSKSSKLIHGGLRYLESFEIGLVYECLSDRKRLLEKYSELVTLQKFFIPVYSFTSRSSFIIRIGLSLYALLGGMQRSNRFKSIPRSEWQRLDGLNTESLKKVFQYYDAQTDDAKLTERLIEEARLASAEILFNSRLVDCMSQPDGVVVSYQQGEAVKQLRGRFLVNAGGPWVNHVLGHCSPNIKPLEIDLVQGTHIEISGQLKQGIYYLEAPQDRRAVFAIPWHEHIMVGTTENIYEGDPAKVTPSQNEVDYLLDVYNHYFSSTEGTKKNDDVLASWAGLRVLPRTSANPFKRTRETIFHRDKNINPRVISIYGGKLTSHHSTAVKLLKLLQRSGL
jgi:glycerol-3-phosphate dehydrogenase